MARCVAHSLAPRVAGASVRRKRRRGRRATALAGETESAVRGTWLRSHNALMTASVLDASAPPSPTAAARAPIATSSKPTTVLSHSSTASGW